MVVKRSAYDAVNGLDESLEVAFNDIDFCLRLRQRGLHNLWTPYAEFIHHESASRGHETTPEKQARFLSEVRFMQARWGHLLHADPAYSPNLTMEREDFSWAWPPRIESQ
jgi:GT2 family glycosyltransferase